MPGENSPSQSRTRQTGFIGSLVALASTLADFFESRAALFATESKAALIQFVLVAICLIAGLLFFAFGYVFLLATAVVAVAPLAHNSWVWWGVGSPRPPFFLSAVLFFIPGSGG